ncbi:MAG: nucleotidyltransferase family protein [Chloroflexi bacterium]|nr:nucleotidyltransferase family protein [Chloroflexota bacterium]
MNMHGIDVPEQAIADVCRRYHIRRLALFGSLLRNQLRSDSDLDVLVEFDENHTPGFAFFDIEAELSQILGRKVDLNTPQFLSPHFRQEVEAQAEVVFGPE